MFSSVISIFNPFIPKSDQCQISPAASPEISHRTVWRTWLFLAYSDERLLYCLFSLLHLFHFSLKGWENVLCELGSERVYNLQNDANVTSNVQRVSVVLCITALKVGFCPFFLRFT